MSLVTQCPETAERFFRPTEKTHPFVDRNARPCRLRTKPKSEQQLWQLAKQSVSTKNTIIELFAVVFFSSVSVQGVAVCFTELAHLLKNDAVGYVAKKVIDRIPR
jgi:hypothetical protein